MSKARCASEPASLKPSVDIEAPHRRRFLAGALGAAVAAPIISAPFVSRAERGSRRFTLLRDGDDIGSHTLTATRTGDTVVMEIDIAIAVKFLGFTAYRYDHTNREVWEGGRLMSLKSRTNEDGDDMSLTVERRGDQLVYNGAPGPDAAPTSYWNINKLDVRPWFSSQTGKILNLNFATEQSNTATRVDISGNFATTLFYDAAGEWRGCEFDGQGKVISYQETAAGPRFREFLA